MNKNKKFSYIIITLIFFILNSTPISQADSYYKHLNKEDYQAVRKDLDKEYIGLGISVVDENNTIKISNVLSYSPASNAGIEKNDTITKINGTNVHDIDFDRALDMLEGKLNQKINLVCKKYSTKKQVKYNLVFQKIKIHTISKNDIIKDSIGYIKLDTFTGKKLVNEVKSSVLDLLEKGIQILIVDLRDNDGGHVQNAIDISNLFLQDVKIVNISFLNGKEKTFYANKNAIFPALPLVILTSKDTASSAEIFAGAIKDNKRGIIIGQNSFGKNSVQGVFPKKDGTAEIITVAKYYPPLGEDIEKIGLRPNIAVGNMNDIMEKAIKFCENKLQEDLSASKPYIKIRIN